MQNDVCGSNNLGTNHQGPLPRFGETKASLSAQRTWGSRVHCSGELWAYSTNRLQTQYQHPGCLQLQVPRITF